MRIPRAISAGPVNMGLWLCKSLGGDVQMLASTGSAHKLQIALAFRVDRAVSSLIVLGSHHKVQRLALLETDLRTGWHGLPSVPDLIEFSSAEIRSRSVFVAEVTSHAADLGALL